MDDNRLAVLSIIVESRAEHAARVNALLSEYAAYIVGRMGIPYHGRGVISVVLDAPAPVANALTGKLGSIPGVTARTLFSKT